MTDKTLRASSPRPSPGARARHARPADACPYPRPFPPGFSRCPVFEAAPFVPVTTTHRPLRPVTSCRHLEVRQEPGAEGCYYPACALGTAEQRAAVDPERGAHAAARPEG